jgi:outer membrane receptor protein involved in Fe transport
MLSTGSPEIGSNDMLRARPSSTKAAWLAAALAIAASTVAPRPAFAQTTGLLEGTVRDPSASPLPGVTVTIHSPRLQGTRTITTESNGVFRFPAVPPGEYVVHVELPGFRAQEKTAIVSLDATATADFTLEQEVTANVVVTGEAPIVDTTSTTTGTNYTSKVITHLPVGRNYADIVRSNPGVDQDRGDTQGRSLALTVYGATSAENQWIIDGVNTTNVMKGSQGKAINNEFVQEVEVKTGGYQAEYGRALGGVINVITKSGGNDFRGDGFYYYDSDRTQADPIVTAQDETLAGMRTNTYERQDYGADLGGYILKDRLWFFAAYNRVVLNSEVSRYVSTDFVSANDRFPIHSATDLYSGKLTWNIATSSTLVGTIFSDPTTNVGAAGSDPSQGYSGINVPPITNRAPTTWFSQRTIGGTDYGFRLNQIFGSAAFATIQASRHQDEYRLSAADLIATFDLTCPNGTPDNPCPPPPVENSRTGGYGAIYGAVDHSHSHRDQIRADLNLYFANNEMKVGGDYLLSKSDVTDSYSGGQQVKIFNEQGTPYYRHEYYAVSRTDLTPLAGALVRPNNLDFGFYVQDSWRPTPGLTVNAGVRWDAERIRNYADVTTIHTSVWQPRVGVVWDPRKDGTTKVYASGGRFSYSLPLDLAARAYGNETQVRVYNFDPTSLVQDPTVPGHPIEDIFGGAYGEIADPSLKPISQDELMVGGERLLNPTLVVGVKGIYRRFHAAIEDRCDLDGSSPDTDYNSCGLMNPGSHEPIASGNIPGCNGLFSGDGAAYSCSDTIPATPPARRLYRGIELFGRWNLGTRLWLQASYLYSSLRGNYDGEVSNGYFGQTDPGINADFDYADFNHNGYGRLALDRPHRFRLDGYYVTPFNLSVGLQTFVSSGTPVNELGFFNDFYGSYIQLVPKGYAGRLPTYWDANLTLSYPIAFGPVTVTLQGYAYSLFNHQTVSATDTQYTIGAPPDYPASLFDPKQPANNPDYGKNNARESPRSFRAAVRVSF